MYTRQALRHTAAQQHWADSSGTAQHWQTGWMLLFDGLRVGALGLRTLVMLFQDMPFKVICCHVVSGSGADNGGMVRQRRPMLCQAMQ